MLSHTYTNYQAEWTPQEIAYLEKYWGEKSDAELAEILDKQNAPVVQRERYRRGLKLPRRGRKPGVRNWQHSPNGVIPF